MNEEGGRAKSVSITSDAGMGGGRENRKTFSTNLT